MCVCGGGGGGGEGGYKYACVCVYTKYYIVHVWGGVKACVYCMCACVIIVHTCTSCPCDVIMMSSPSYTP